MTQEEVFKCKGKSEYYIDDVTNSISKLNKKGQKQLLTYNDLTKMYLDFSGVSLTPDQTKKIKNYLLTHPMTTFFFCQYPKDKFDGNNTVETIVEKLAKHNGKLLSCYASSILFQQTEGLSYDQMIDLAKEASAHGGEENYKDNPNWLKLSDKIRMSINSFNHYYLTTGLKTFTYFPKIAYRDFLWLNQAIYRNSSSVEQTLKLINLDPNSVLYDKTVDVWSNYLQGKNSQLSFKEAFPILNLTCTYSLYKINFKDKDFENLIKNNIAYWEKHRSSNRYDEESKIKKILTEPNGKKLVKTILKEKVASNVGLTNVPEIRDYLVNTFNLDNYIKDEDAEKDKMVKWFMENENSTNRELYEIQTSELVAHNVEHAINKAIWLVENYNKDLQYKQAIPQELQKYCSSGLSKNVQTPKIYEQLKELIKPKGDDDLDRQANIIKFFNLLNKSAIKMFKDQNSKQINLPDIFSRYFSDFTKYFSGRADKSLLSDISKTFVELMGRRDELPAWVLKSAFTNEHRNYDGNLDLRDLTDNIKQLESIKEFLKYSDSDLYKQAYEINKDSEPLCKYIEALSNGKSSKTLTYIDETDYDIYKFFKSLDLDPKDPQFEAKLEHAVGRYIIQSTGLKHDISKIREVKNIKNVTSENLSELSRLSKCIKHNSFASLLEEKAKLAKTVYTQLEQVKEGLTGEELAKKVSLMKANVVDKKFQTIYEDDHYTCFIPTFDDIREWARKMGNCMANCYLPNVQRGEGLFLYICKKGQYGVPLNATYLVTPYSSNYYGHRRDEDSVVAQIAKNLKFNKSTADKKSKNFGQPKKKLFEGLEVNECKNNGGEMCGQPAIYDLVAHNGKKIQSEKEREHLYDFCCALREKFGFDGRSYFADFDRKMEYYTAKKKASKAKIH